MQLTTPQAAALTGKSRFTIWRACRRGRLSARRSETGSYLIDLAELERTFGKLGPRARKALGASINGTAKADATAPDRTPGDPPAQPRLQSLEADWGD